MPATAKVFMHGRSQAIRLPKEYRVAGGEVRLSRVPGGLLVTEVDPWESFRQGCHALDESFFEALDSRARRQQQDRDFTGGLAPDSGEANTHSKL